jgi:hypothetical protein
MLNIMRRMRTRDPTCLSIGFGAFLAIKVSYATVALRLVTIDAACAIRRKTRIGKRREKEVKIFLSFQ